MTPFKVTFIGLEDTMSDYNSCGVTEEQRSSEGFFAIEALASERWHIMARPEDPSADVSIQVLSSCDERTCVRSASLCHGGHAEHLNFVAPMGGTYIISLESTSESPVTLLVVKPPCGDGKVQHGESCDDGNSAARDGCDPSCRAEVLATAPAETEPNNELIEANLIRFSDGDTGMMAIAGQIGGACDVDRFALEVPDGSSIRATVLDATGMPCAADSPMVHLQLFDATTGRVRGEKMSTAGDVCPSILDTDAFAMGLSAGEYHVTIEAVAPHDESGDGAGDAAEPDLFVYQVVLEVVAPTS